jgi:CII-binding regulator of phage lambda lysogenization HflD
MDDSNAKRTNVEPYHSKIWLLEDQLQEAQTENQSNLLTIQGLKQELAKLQTDFNQQKQLLLEYERFLQEKDDLIAQLYEKIRQLEIVNLFDYRMKNCIRILDRVWKKIMEMIFWNLIKGLVIL